MVEVVPYGIGVVLELPRHGLKTSWYFADSTLRVSSYSCRGRADGIFADYPGSVDLALGYLAKLHPFGV